MVRAVGGTASTTAEERDMTDADLNKPQLVVAMDHGRAMGAVPGLEDPGRVIDAVVEAGADGIMTSFGVVKHYRDRLIGRIPTWLRLDGGPSILKEAWLTNTEWSLLHTLEEAEVLGCRGACLMYFMGAECELETLEIVAGVCNEALRSGMPVMVEALPSRHPNIPDTNDAGMMADACRIAFEHGADVLKTYYPGTPEGFAQVVKGTPAPVLIAGGPKLDSDLAVLDMVAATMAQGGRGVVFGRNIWQHRRPDLMVKALRAVIHDGASGADAAELLGG
jgi:DhnA family fructose-bisphosphate aldolase class Ia